MVTANSSAVGQFSCRHWPGLGFVILVLAILLDQHSYAVAPDKGIRRILILNEVGTSYLLTNLVDQGIRAVFEKSPYRIEVYREYMETLVCPDAAVQQQFCDVYVRKSENRKLDVVITVGPAPLRFTAQEHRKHFRGVPVVFCFPEGLFKTIPLDSEFTGVEGEYTFAETVSAALRLLPDTKHVVVVGGTSDFDRQQQSLVRMELKRHEGSLSISYLTDLPMAGLLEQLKRLPTRTIVLMTLVSRDASGVAFRSRDSGPMIVAAASAPVFTSSDRFFDHSEVGGKVSSAMEQGKLVAGIGVRLIQGERAASIPLVKAATDYTFDWRALRRWRLKKRDLPPESVVLYRESSFWESRESSFWESYEGFIIGGIFLMLAELLLIVGLMRQRARRRKAETSLEIAYDRLRLALEAGKAVGWEWDIKSGRDRWFGDLQTMFGIPSGTYAGNVNDFLGRVYPDDRELASKALADARQNRRPFIAEFRVLHTDGTVHWITERGRFYYASNGDAERMMGMALDITDRRQMEQKLRESEQRFRVVANTAPVMIWMSGPDKLCNYFNKPWLDFVGRPIEKELGHGWADGVHPEDLDRCFRKYTEAFDKAEPFDMQYRLRRHDGEYRWVLDIGVPRFDTDGSLAGYIGSCLDVTERKLAEEALATIGRRLIEAHEEERTWIGRELHDDINQRLALLAVELDRGAQESSFDTNLLDCIREAQRRITEISRDVQHLSHRLHSSKLDYLGLATASKSFCRELSEKTNVEVAFSHSGIPSALPNEVSLCLFRVMQEALQNAIKYSGARTFTVDLRGTVGTIELTVKDNGSGFDIGETITRHGLGLISMRERLQIVHGEFEVKTKPGAGTTIYARVPLKALEYQAMAG